MSLHFVWPWLFALLPLPLLIWWWWPKAQSHQPQAIHMPLYARLHEQMALPSHSTTSHKGWRWLGALLIWALLLGAAARPQSIGESVALPQNGRNLMLAVDISGSMAKPDMILGQYQVSRLTAVKAVAGQFIERRVGDREGLILFGRHAYLQAPLTFDRDTVKTLLDEAVIGLAGKETALGDAIALGVKRLREQPQGNRVLILLTDGTNTAGNIPPLKAAELAQAEGVRIYTIGIGADQEVRNLFGQSISLGTDLDEAGLQKIAAMTGGDYYRARNLQALQAIYQKLDELEPLAKDTLFYRDIHEWYLWPLGLALLLSAQMGLLASVSRMGLLGKVRQEVDHA